MRAPCCSPFAPWPKDLRSVPGRKMLVLFSSGFPFTAERQSELTATIDACNKSNVAVYSLDVRGLQALQAAAASSHLSRSDRLNAVAARHSHGKSCASGARLLLAAFSDAAASWRWRHRWNGRRHWRWRPRRNGGGTGGTGGTRRAGGTAVPEAPAVREWKRRYGGTGGGKGGTGGTGTGTTGRGGTGGGTRGGYPTNYNNNPLNQPRSIVPQFPESTSTNQQILAALAEGTGGFTIFNTNDLFGGLQRIANEQNEFYLLGYVPPRIRGRQLPYPESKNESRRHECSRAQRVLQRPPAEHSGRHAGRKAAGNARSRSPRRRRAPFLPGSLFLHWAEYRAREPGHGNSPGHVQV